MAHAVFICGPAGTGKTTVGKVLVMHMLAKGMHACLLDKDTLTDGLSRAYMQELTGDGADRDSATYKTQVRDLEYFSVLETARENLELGVSCVMPAPWTKELKDGSVSSVAAMCLPRNTKIHLVWLELSDQERRKRIEQRGHNRDAYKLTHWAQVGAAADAPEIEGMLKLDAGLSVPALANAIVEHMTKPRGDDSLN